MLKLKTRNALHLLFVALCAALVGISFLQEPPLEDDLTYWSFGADLHERRLSAWQQASFYHLRWPVWGVCWLLQSLAGLNLVSYWGVSVLYLAAGAALAFAVGKRLTNSDAAGWACGLAFAFHPFLDPVASSPMPDLAEAVWSGAVVLAWWNLMETANAKRAWFFATLTGLFVVIVEANRITGVFLVPVLVLCTALFFRPRFRWLLAGGLIAIGLYAAECAFYHHLFGDWLHDLSANALNRGARGTELSNPWLLPVRFLDSFWQGPLVSAYTCAALFGAWRVWRKSDRLGHVVLIWFGFLLFEYSCAPQSLSPLRPLVRDGTRFLASLALPMSILALLGFLALVRQIIPRRLINQPHPLGAVSVLLAVAFFILLTKRSFFDPGFVPELRAYLAAVPNDTSIFTHPTMRDIVRLVDAPALPRLRWSLHNHILEHDPEAEAAAQQCDQFWYARKLTWLPARQQLQRTQNAWRPELASYFRSPEENWTLAGSIPRAGAPDLVFYHKGSAAEPHRVESEEVLSPLPIVWERGRAQEKLDYSWNVPPRFRGQLVRLELEAASPAMDAIRLRFRFRDGNRKEKSRLLLRPFLFPLAVPDFFAIRIPDTATTCDVQLRFTSEAKHVEIARLRVVQEFEAAR